MCCTNFEYSKVSLEAVNKPFYGFSQYMCNSVEVVKICRSGKCLIGLAHCPHLPDLKPEYTSREVYSLWDRVEKMLFRPSRKKRNSLLFNNNKYSPDLKCAISGICMYYFILLTVGPSNCKKGQNFQKFQNLIFFLKFI
jgi:hypothetical protein